MTLRASYGHSIRRPQWNHIQGGQTIDQFAGYEGGTGSQGDPGLKPLESKNFDLSFEWYYGEASYLSVGYFRKDIDNYIGTAQREIHPGLPTPVGGRSAEHTSELQTLMRITYAVFCLKKKTQTTSPI